jgi:WD40 repeat protein
MESCTQISSDWRDEEEETGVNTIALSPYGKTIASGCDDGKVRLWDIIKRKKSRGETPSDNHNDYQNRRR